MVTDENTYSLAEASAVYGQEVGLLAEIIEDYANRVLPVKISNEEELEQYQDDENGFEKIQTTKGLIKYLKARIEGQKTRLDKANIRLSEKVAKLKNDFLESSTQRDNAYQELSQYEDELIEKIDKLNSEQPLSEYELLEPIFSEEELNGFSLKYAPTPSHKKFIEDRQKRMSENFKPIKEFAERWHLTDLFDIATTFWPPGAGGAKLVGKKLTKEAIESLGKLASNPKYWEDLASKKGFDYAKKELNDFVSFLTDYKK